LVRRALSPTIGKGDLSVFVWHGGGRGGAERVMLGLAEGFRKHAGAEPVLGVFERNEELDFEQVEVRKVFPRRMTGYNNIWASLQLGRGGILRKFDIVLAHGGGFWKAGENFYVCHEAGDLDSLSENLPPVSCLGFLPLRWLYIKTMAQADLLISATRECDEFLERHGIKYVKGRNFIDTRFFRPGRKRPRDVFRVLFVGRDEPRKNLRALKEACRRIEGVKLLVVGAEGRDEKKIKHLGWISDEELAELYRTSHLFALPSFWEGFSISVLEAMASQTPILAGVRAVPRELIEHVITFDPGVRGELERKLRWATENYRELEEIAKRARRFVEENFEKEKVVRWEVQTIIEKFKKRCR
jgi:glycosyltransferase involved in cell wall biosynthesis